RFVGNAAGHGGAIATYRDNISFTNCEFSGNTAYGTTWRGGGGAIHSYQDGGVDNLVGVTLLHCTFSKNSSDDDGGGAIFLFYQFSIFKITGSIFWDNTHFGGVIAEEAQIYEKFGPADVTVHHTLIQGWTGIFGGIGNFGDNPLFVDASGGDGIVGTADDDLRIRGGSPCIDAGDNSALPGGLTTDLDGNPRIVNGIVDLGAYEFQLECGNGECAADESPCTCSEDCGDPPSSEDPGSSCADGVDNDCDALTDCEDPDCVTACPVPTVSAWGVCCMMLLLLTAGSLVLREREHRCRMPIR
ncbi:MAG: hypothetical protein IH987_13475, partial [Planctomycetes bacterium]|nr:hypothetical protein [Planctomycetota bacterium]